MDTGSKSDITSAENASASTFGKTIDMHNNISTATFENWPRPTETATVDTTTSTASASTATVDMTTSTASASTAEKIVTWPTATGAVATFDQGREPSIGQSRAQLIDIKTVDSERRDNLSQWNSTVADVSKGATVPKTIHSTTLLRRWRLSVHIMDNGEIKMEVFATEFSNDALDDNWLLPTLGGLLRSNSMTITELRVFLFAIKAVINPPTAMKSSGIILNSLGKHYIVLKPI